MDTRLNSQRKRTAGSPENFHPQKFEIRKITSFLPSKISILDLWGLILSWIRFFLQKETAPRKTHRAPFRNTRFPPVSLLRKKKQQTTTETCKNLESTFTSGRPSIGDGMTLCTAMRGRCGAVALWIPKTTPSVFAAGTAKNGMSRQKWGGNIPSKGGNQEIGEFFFLQKGIKRWDPLSGCFFCLGGVEKKGNELLAASSQYLY